MEFEGYKIFVSDKSPKKYYALVDGKKIYFGDRNYQQYHDKLGHYKSLDHNDAKRRKLYHKRHAKDYPRGSADYFSKRILW